MTPHARALRRTALAAGAVASLGVLLCVAGVVAGVLAGGVPYHDGPNAGFASPPGFRRVLEELAVPLLGVGVLVLAAAAALALAVGARLALARLRRHG